MPPPPLARGVGKNQLGMGRAKSSDPPGTSEHPAGSSYERALLESRLY